ncbi:hypothetical protein ISN44_As08g012280 [Arabidopsis suecica]|uniref:Uncharacterized protein n=1 Tax=Arabidopsis suecica TaxID=45249 RepID=A0A8T2B7J7_ARASU|nr:hypothetical protein ISN44_As08g012280 [Arabidopsis suecica]
MNKQDDLKVKPLTERASHTTSRKKQRYTTPKTSHTSQLQDRNQKEASRATRGGKPEQRPAAALNHSQQTRTVHQRRLAEADSDKPGEHAKYEPEEGPDLRQLRQF